MQILLSNSHPGPGRTVKQEQEEISRNHVQAFIPGSVDGKYTEPRKKVGMWLRDISSYPCLAFLPGPAWL